MVVLVIDPVSVYFVDLYEMKFDHQKLHVA
jgi:hypothetical protein